MTLSCFISIVIPVYNIDIALFKECIQSLSNIKEKDCEFILVDDGSTNGCQDMCDVYGEIDNFKVIHQKNAGVAVARNTGMSIASGEYITFVDPDDMISEDFYDIIKMHLENYQVDMASFAYKEFCGNTEYIRRFFEKNREWQGNNVYECIDIALSAILPGGDNTFVTVWGSIYNLNFLRSNNLAFSPELRKVQDLLFNLQALDCAKKVSYFTDIIYLYRNNPNSICHSYNPNMAEYYRRVLRALYSYELNSNYCKTNPISDKIENWKVFFITDIVSLDLLNENNPSNRSDRKRKYHEIVSMDEFCRPKNLKSLDFYSKRNFLGRILIPIFFMKNFSLLEIWKYIVRLRRIL